MQYQNLQENVRRKYSKTGRNIVIRGLSEIHTIYGQLQDALGVEVEPAPDEWDRGHNVDFFIRVNDKYIGPQIKPAGYTYITQIINELKFQEQSHKKFAAKYG